jgi:hypothetical protein
MPSEQKINETPTVTVTGAFLGGGIVLVAVLFLLGSFIASIQGLYWLYLTLKSMF